MGPRTTVYNVMDKAVHVRLGEKGHRERTIHPKSSECIGDISCEKLPFAYYVGDHGPYEVPFDSLGSRFVELYITERGCKQQCKR